MIATQQPTKVRTSKWHNEATGANITTDIHETATQIKIYSDNALLTTAQKVVDGYQFDGYIFDLFIELMDYILTGDSVVVLNH